MGNPEEKMKLIAIRLKPQLYQDLHREAEERGYNFSAYVRAILNGDELRTTKYSTLDERLKVVEERLGMENDISLVNRQSQSPGRM